MKVDAGERVTAALSVTELADDAQTGEAEPSTTALKAKTTPMCVTDSRKLFNFPLLFTSAINRSVDRLPVYHHLMPNRSTGHVTTPGSKARAQLAGNRHGMGGLHQAARQVLMTVQR
jgi:hypothetical protein